MGKTIQITKAQLQRLVENREMSNNYMFFGNLEQIERQCKILRQIDPEKINDLLNNGHDWADDHVTEAKVNMDQVFDFIMNTFKGGNPNKKITADTDQFSLNEECWEGYKKVGGKMKNGKMVPNCVPVNKSVKEASSPAQQAAIAIAKKKESNESEKEMYESMEIDESKNCPTDPGKWAASKAAAKAKFDVYPSAYANGWAAKNYKSKGGGWRKCK